MQLLLGDRNTSYFHIMTVVRRQRNKIRCVMDRTGEWIYDEAKIKDHIQDGFSKLYTSKMCMVSIESLFANFSCYMLFEEESRWMGREVDDEEIKTALWSLKPFKAPGPDGIHAGFFQYFWHDVQALICQEVKKAFTLVSIPKFLNTTFITLIPKCKNPRIFSCYILSEEESRWMGREVDDEEIRTALWSLKPFKAPGPDGIHAGFFQYFWHGVQALICQEVKKAFTLVSIPKFLNTTFITLIPKCKNPQIFGQLQAYQLMQFNVQNHFKCVSC